MANDILKYTSRDYDSIKTDLIESISALSDTWTSRDDGDPGIVLIKLMSALGDMLSFNMDKQALEYYAPTVTQRKNAAKLFELIGYRMHWYRAAETTLTLTNRAPMQQYIYMYKQAIDLCGGKEVIEKNYNNLTEFIYNLETHDPNTYTALLDIERAYDNAYTSNTSVYFPPITEPLPMNQPSRYSYSSEQGEKPIEFIQYSFDTYKYWQEDNTVDLYTYIEDHNKTLGVYSTEASSIPYMLIPTTELPAVNPVTHQYEPQIRLLPYESKDVRAIQGNLCETSFTGSQLRDNRFYLPDTTVDEQYIYICYTTNTNNIIQEVPIFLKKTDNLLTVVDFTTDDTDTIIYFQFGVDDFDCPYIELASYWDSIVSKDSVKFKLYYVRTRGKNGNISTNYLSRIDNASTYDVSVLNVMNTEYVTSASGEYLSSPGYNPQTASDAYADSINYVMTYNTLVTIYDFSRFLKRQNGITNGFACDIQYAIDLNKEIYKVCTSYTEQQLRDILGENAPEDATQIDLANYLYLIRKINYDYSEDSVTLADVLQDSPTKDFVTYNINLYPIWNDFDVEYVKPDGTPVKIAKLDNEIKAGKKAPYKLYRINTEESEGSANPDSFMLETTLNNAIRSTKIVNVQPSYTACRVFNWRCCGTLHLTQSVTNVEAETIIKSVIGNLTATYAPSNIEFGKKITYMEVIDTIVSSDSRIRYFDAGIGSKKLIEFDDLLAEEQTDEKYFNIEAYFNPESIMRYVQTYEDNNSTSSKYYNMICIDPTYLQTSSNTT